MTTRRSCSARPTRSDGAQVAQLVMRVRPAIGNVVRCVLGANDPDHEDVLQMAVERLLSTMSETPLHGGSVVQLAAVIARNVAVDARRARARRMRVFCQDEDARASFSEEVDPERLACARELLAQFSGALGGLRADSAKVVYAHDVLGHELAEIAEMLGISVAAAQSRLVRGRGRIVVLLRIRSSSPRTSEMPEPNDGPYAGRRLHTPPTRRVSEVPCGDAPIHAHDLVPARGDPGRPTPAGASCTPTFHDNGITSLFPFRAP